MDRPPSARPGTRHQQISRPGTAATVSSSSGHRRPKTAGRNSERPPKSSAGYSVPAPPPPPPQLITVPRPQLNNELMNTPPTAGGIRPGTRIGSVAGSRIGTASGITSAVQSTGLPSSRATSRLGAMSRMGTAASGRVFRPGTMSSRASAIVGAGGQFPVGTAARPITQQGVSGARTASRIGTAIGGGGRVGTSMGSRMGGSRMVADKSYYIGLLNNQLNSLEAELTNLDSELQKAEKGRENLLIYEQRAEQQAQELKQLQGQLADYNLIIDRQNTNTNLRLLESEVEEAEIANQDLTTEVEELFKERRLREEHVQELEQRVERMRTQNAQKMDQIAHDLKDEFDQVTAEADTLKAELERKQTELEELTKQKEEIELALANSPMKQQAMLLEEQLQELREKRTNIVAELRSEETPEMQREHFVQRIQRDNEEIGHMQAQLQEMNERMTQAQEELQEFQNEFELLAGDKSERFRELKTRENHMDTFLNGFDESKSQIESRIGALSKQIIRELQLISMNCRHGELAVNVTGLDESLLALGSAGVSANELQDLHVRLQEELITMGQQETLLHTELTSMRTKQAEIDEEMAKMGDVEGHKNELRAQGRELVAKRSALEEELNRLEAENARLKEQTEAEERRIGIGMGGGGGGDYQLNRPIETALFYQLKELKSRVDGLEADRRTLDERLKAEQAKHDYEPMKQKALELRAEYNELLISATLGGRQGQKSAH